METIRFSVLALIVLIHPVVSNAQTSPEALLSRLPAVPTIACGSDTTEMMRFVQRIYEVQVSLQEVVDRIHADERAQAAASESSMVSDALRKSGLTEDDVEKLDQMSEADQAKWAKEYAATMMRKAQQGGTTDMQNQAGSARLFALANEQKSLGERITERMKRAAEMLQNVERKDSIERIQLDAQMRPLESQLCSGICSPAEIARSKAAEKQIYALKIRHCEKMSPLLTDAISQYLTTLKALLPDYRKLAKVQNEIVRLQKVGLVTSDDLSCYSAVVEYADVLSGAYKYWVGPYEQ